MLQSGSPISILSCFFSLLTDSIGLHRIENVSHTDTAASLHVYIPAFDMCQSFDQRTGHKRKCQVTFWSKYGTRTPYVSICTTSYIFLSQTVNEHSSMMTCWCSGYTSDFLTEDWRVNCWYKAILASILLCGFFGKNILLQTVSLYPAVEMAHTGASPEGLKCDPPITFYVKTVPGVWIFSFINVTSY